MSEASQVFGIHMDETATGGALIIRSQPYWKGETTVACLLNSLGQQMESYVATYREYKKGVFDSVVAAVFTDLPAGNYDVFWTEQSDFQKNATVEPGKIVEVSFP